MYKTVSKRTIKRIDETYENEELNIMKLTLELAKESDNELWKELILLHLDNIKLLNDKNKEKIIRKLKRDL